MVSLRSNGPGQPEFPGQALSALQLSSSAMSQSTWMGSQRPTKQRQKSYSISSRSFPWPAHQKHSPDKNYYAI
eukprot:3820027-Amphidinium_carterae.1